MVHGTVEGDGNVTVNSFAKIEEGHPGAISFLANPKYEHYIYNTGSSVVLVSNDFVPESEIKATLIRVDDPYGTIAQLLEMVDKATHHLPSGIEQPSFIADGVIVPEDAYVGAFAYIAKNVKIAAGVKIFPNTYIGENVEIGENTVLYPGVKIYHDCKIGCNCIVHAGAVIGADGFGFAPDKEGVYNKIPQLGNVIIQDNVEIGANTCIDRAVMGSTTIHKGVKLDNLIQIAHNVTVGENTVMASQVGIAGSAHIGRSCMFGGQVGIAGHISIGDNVKLGAQSGIPNSVKDGSSLLGTPGIPALDFARQVALLKRLRPLFDRVDDIEKSIANLQK